jgi:hypothetical protein
MLEASQLSSITKKARRRNASQPHRSTHEYDGLAPPATPEATSLPPARDAGAVDVVAALMKMPEGKKILRSLLLRMVAKLREGISVIRLDRSNRKSHSHERACSCCDF